MGIRTSRHFDWPLWGTHGSRRLVAARCKTKTKTQTKTQTQTKTVRVGAGGANLPRQADVFPDRDHFGRIFYNQVGRRAQPVGAWRPL